MAERAIRIEADGVRLYAILHDTPVATAVWDALPLEGTARLADDEVSIDAGTGFPAGPAGRAVQARPGDLLYRARLGTIALVHGPAAAEGPGARRPDPDAAIFGRITGDTTRLTRVKDGARVRLTALEG